MGERIRAKDWASTPLGPVEQWPQSLKIIVRIMLTSRQPIWVGWGPDLIKLYNDPYKAIVGGKHPEALGQPASVVWREIWDKIGPRLQTTIQENKGTYDEALQLMMERYGYPEETYYTFSYSPVPDEQGNVGGIICANTDDTARIISERQVKLLRTLASETADARTIEEACRVSAAALAHNPFDLPFALLYLFDQQRRTMTLAGASGIVGGHPAAPETVDLETATPWPFAEVLATQRTYTITDLDARFPDLPTGAWERPSKQALAVPITLSGQTGKVGVLLVGLNPFRLFDESYQGFLNLVAGQITSSLANAQAYEEERKRAEALAEIDRAKTLFFSNVSHEFRTPLTLMLGPIEETLAEQQTLSPEQRERTETLYRNALRLLKLVNTLLDFSRIEAGRLQAVYRPADLARLTRDLASSFRSVIEKAGLSFTVDCPELALPVYVDIEMWEKIVLNLVSNAFKYTLQGGITVRLQLRGPAVELSVEDTGVGIPEAELPHMFERFHRVKGTIGRTIEGTGIGLSMVQELVRLHGGTISVSSQPGVGSVFTVSLPPGQAHLPVDRIASPANYAETSFASQVYVDEALRSLAGRSEETDILDDISLSDDSEQPGTQQARILFADDNADMRDYISRLLRPYYAITVVPDGRAALAAMKASPADLVLSDVMMPYMDGFELLQTLRTDPQTQTVPVILLSARAGEEAKIEGMQARADDYLTKPFSARELLVRVRTHLEMARLRKESEERIKAERQRLYDLFMQAPVNITILRGPNYEVELANPGVLALWGKTQEEAIGRPYLELLPEVREIQEPLLRRVLTTGIPYVGSELFIPFDRLGDGTLTGGYFTFVYTPLRGLTNQIEGIMSVGYEVTRQVLARQQVEISEERFRTLADNMSQLAWITDETGKIVWYNKRWYDYTGTTFAQMQEPDWSPLLPDDYTERVMEKLRRCFEEGTEWEDTFPLRGKDGTFRWFLSRAIAIRDEQGQVRRWFGTNTDITEQRRLEQQKDEFLGVASHELKTPVTSLKAFAQLLERRFRQSGDTRSADLVQKIDVQAVKLTRLVDDLLDVTKIENGQLVLHPSSFVWNELVMEVVEDIRRSASRHQIVVDLAASVVMLVDRDRMSQVLTNLLTNAIKYSPHADLVKVQTKLTESALITSVQDAGIGIPQEKQVHLFERFYRVEGESQLTYPGLGLGLYISAEFVKRHHGTIWLESSPGTGTTVSFSLPLPPAPSTDEQ
jgi:PAS domain S-box-containing protein